MNYEHYKIQAYAILHHPFTAALFFEWFACLFYFFVVDARFLDTLLDQNRFYHSRSWGFLSLLTSNLALAMSIRAFAPLGASQLNPIITMALVCIRQIPAWKGACYILMQLLASVIAAVLVPLLYNFASYTASGTFPYDIAIATVIHPLTQATGIQILLCQIPVIAFFTMFFLSLSYDFELKLGAFLVPCRLSPERSKSGLLSKHGTGKDHAPSLAMDDLTAMMDNSINSIKLFASSTLLGCLLIVSVLSNSTITGGTVNPAKIFGPALINGQWNYTWAYWVGGIIGAVIGSLMYRFLYVKATRYNWKKVDQGTRIEPT